MMASALLLLLPSCIARDNGLALTPPMGFNSYMVGSGLSGEAGLGSIASFEVTGASSFNVLVGGRSSIDKSERNFCFAM